ncbi:MAG: DUF6443 domain-containing protein [Flavobacteriaceae bacterium]|nr:DUF6443 domain-containing protein [Flavobacteriaceae bacterium]
MKTTFFFFTFAFSGISFWVFGQSLTENYIKTTEYLTENANLNQAKITVQYFDGLGRPSQVVAHKQAPGQKDIITHIEYDDYGRQVKEFLPFRANRASLNYEGNAGQGTMNYYQTHYNTQIAFSEKELETSPLNRVLKQAAPGNDWALNAGNEIEFDYQTNMQNEVIIFRAHITSVNFNIYRTSLQKGYNGKQYYTAGQLNKTITKDENHQNGNNNTIEEFKNKQGQVILKRTYENNEPHDTYYVYDDFGNLNFVLPPLANHENMTIAELNNLGYQYVYDNRNRLAEKKLPGKGWEYMLYDKQNRLVGTQDSILKVQGKWLFTKYDKFGRVAYTGIVNSSENRHNLQTFLNTNPTFATNNVARTANVGFTMNGLAVYYQRINAWPSSFTEILSVNYYDSYANITPSNLIPASVYGETIISQVPNNQGVTTKGLNIATFLRILNENKWEKIYTFYDTKSRPVRTHKINYLGGKTITDVQLDFRGKVLEDKTNHSRLNNGGWNIRNFYTYDHAERLLTHKHQIDNGLIEVLANNEYDNLGQLRMKNVGGKENYDIPLQSIDYKYNIRGWLTDINNIDNLYDQKSSEFMDIWAFRINYNTPINRDNDVEPLYNGNISETYWRTGNDNMVRGYGFTYDALNRLKAGNYRKPSATVYVDNFNESLTYDKNGNIKSLQRRGGFDHPLSAGMDIDLLNYTYMHNGKSNQLLKVTDATGSHQGFHNGTSGTQNDYTYDANGNMISDRNKGITQIQYNHLNLPTQINLNGLNSGEITYVYNAAGAKVQKKVTQDSYTITTDYLDGFQYENEQLMFFGHAEGYVSLAQIPELMEVKKLSYVYNYVDHLGNIRLSYTEDPKHPNELIILEENNYYPFGLKHQDYNKELKKVDFWKYAGLPQQEIIDHAEKFISIVPVVKGEYKYKFQNQELQDELGLNWYSFKWRNYMPDIGRFFNPDPLSEQYAYQSHYNFSENRVIDGRELEGLEYVSVHHYANGAVSKTEYYKMSNSQIKRLGGTTAGIHNSVPYGAGGKGIAHYYYNDAGNRIDTKTHWEQQQTGGTSDFAYHGLYSGPGSITYDGVEKSTNYNFDAQPIDYADAIAKRHDMDYAAAAGENYAGYLEDVRTLQADRDMVQRIDDFVNPFKSVNGIETPVRTSYSTEMDFSMLGQRVLINALATYKQWKVDKELGNDNLYKDNREAFGKAHPGTAKILDQLPKEQ